MKLLYAEDERAMSEAVVDILTYHNYIVDVVYDGVEALDYARTEHYDGIILDIMMPNMSGLEVLQILRAEGCRTPVLLLTAKAEVEDQIQGLDLGADDYLPKPFSMQLLLARVRALLRRAHTEAEPALEVLDFGDLVIDISGHKVIVEGTEVDLTASEFKLLTTLARYPGRVYTRMELVEKVLGYDFEGYERTIDSHVKNLRAKLGDDPRNPRWLYTVHGVGYRFEAPEKPADAK